MTAHDDLREALEAVAHELHAQGWNTGPVYAKKIRRILAAHPAPAPIADRCTLPCCTSCDGYGNSSDAETNGACWDCMGTGHPHSHTAPLADYHHETCYHAGKTVDETHGYPSHCSCVVLNPDGPDTYLRGRAPEKFTINPNTGEWLDANPMSQEQAKIIAASVLPGVSPEQVGQWYSDYMNSDPKPEPTREERLVGVFKEAWHEADSQFLEGRRTECGIRAVLAAIEADKSQSEVEFIDFDPEPVEVFGPGDVVRYKARPKTVFTIAENGRYLHEQKRVVMVDFGAGHYPSEHYERVETES